HVASTSSVFAWARTAVPAAGGFADQVINRRSSSRAISNLPGELLVNAVHLFARPFQASRAIDHVIGAAALLFGRHLRRNPPFGLLARYAGLGDEAFHLLLGTAPGDHDFRETTPDACLKDQGGIHHDDGTRVLGAVFGRQLFNAGNDARMHDG